MNPTQAPSPGAMMMMGPPPPPPQPLQQEREGGGCCGMSRNVSAAIGQTLLTLTMVIGLIASITVLAHCTFLTVDLQPPPTQAPTMSLAPSAAPTDTISPSSAPSVSPQPTNINEPTRLPTTSSPTTLLPSSVPSQSPSASAGGALRQRNLIGQPPRDLMLEVIDNWAFLEGYSKAGLGMYKFDPVGATCGSYPSSTNLGAPIQAARVTAWLAFSCGLCGCLSIFIESLFCRFYGSRCSTIVFGACAALSQAITFIFYASDVCGGIYQGPAVSNSQYVCSFGSGSAAACVALVMYIIACIVSFQAPRPKPLLVQLRERQDEHDTCCAVFAPRTQKNDDEEEGKQDCMAIFACCARNNNKEMEQHEEVVAAAAATSMDPENPSTQNNGEEEIGRRSTTTTPLEGFVSARNVDTNIATTNHHARDANVGTSFGNVQQQQSMWEENDDDEGQSIPPRPSSGSQDVFFSLTPGGTINVQKRKGVKAPRESSDVSDESNGFREDEHRVLHPGKTQLAESGNDSDDSEFIYLAIPKLKRINEDNAHFEVVSHDGYGNKRIIEYGMKQERPLPKVAEREVQSDIGLVGLRPIDYEPTPAPSRIPGRQIRVRKRQTPQEDDDVSHITERTYRNPQFDGTDMFFDAEDSDSGQSEDNYR